VNPATLPGLERNAVIAASAGTGKTQLITSIYIAHVLGLGPSGRVSPERIVATTFSRLAAQEIRERLERRLSELAEAASEEALERLDPVLAAQARASDVSARELAARSARALAELPRTLIDTLHGLSARVIRSLALELGIGPGFAILDEQPAFEDAEGTIEDVLSEALARGGDSLEAVIRLIDAAGGLEATRSLLIGFLGILDEEGLDADALGHPDPLAETDALLGAFAAGARALLDGGAEPALAEAARRALAAIERTPPDLEALELAFAELVEQRVQARIARLPTGRSFATAIDQLMRGKSKRDRVRASVAFLRSAPELRAESRAVAELIGTVQRTLRARRKRRGTLGFGDLLRIARDALRDDTELAARAGADIDLLLVDEFQDTSRVQRDLILLLRERPQARAARTPGTLPTPDAIASHGLVVVGDRKQSIYAFRGADVSVFAELVAELAGEPAAQALDLRGVRPNPHPVADFVPLTTNYRSGSNILAFVNAVSALDFTEDPRAPFEIRYAEAEALVPPKDGRRGAGSVVLIEDDGEHPEGADALVTSAEGPLRAAFVAAGYCARAHSAGVALSDLAILARRRSSLPMVELALDRLGIPFVVSGRALYATSEVRDLAALLRVALDPYNRHALAAVARSPLGGLSDKTLAELSHPGRGLARATAWSTEAISDPAQAQRARELSRRLAELELTLPLLSPRDALACAIERFELEVVLGGLARGAVRFGNAGRLLDIAGRHGGSLPMFVRWLDRQIALDTDESEAAVFSEEDEAVRLLTIHASKGLSFPVTIVVDVGATEQPRSPALSLLRTSDRPELVIRHRRIDGPIATPLLGRALQDAQARVRAERQRLSYVALTRAERELVLVLPAEARENSLAASVSRLLAGDLAGELPVSRIRASELLALGVVPPAPVPLPSPPPARPTIGRVESVAIGVTALADFALCPRRFSLLHVFGVGEPNQPVGRDAQAGEDARRIGSAAHQALERFPLSAWGGSLSLVDVLAALEREGLDGAAQETRETAEGILRFLQGDYAKAVRARGARVHRELELSLVLALPPGPARAPQLELFPGRERPSRTIVKAMLDAVVDYGDGTLDVIDYKRSRGGDEKRYAVQLHIYAEAVRAAFGARAVRTGLVHLLGSSAEPEWVASPPIDIALTVADLGDRRYRGDYPPVSPERCRAARCGFLGACYPRKLESALGPVAKR